MPRSKQKRCRRCRHFLALSWKHNYCLSCKRKLLKEARRVQALAQQVIRFTKASKRREEEEKNEPLWFHSDFVSHELPAPKNAKEAMLQAANTGLTVPKGICEICNKPGPLSVCKKFTINGKKLRDQVTACGKCRDGFLKLLGYTAA